MQHPRTQVDDDADATRRVVAHREGVVRRLLYAGLSARLLRALLPEWCPLIERIAGTDTPPPSRSVTADLSA